MGGIAVVVLVVVDYCYYSNLTFGSLLAVVERVELVACEPVEASVAEKAAVHHVDDDVVVVDESEHQRQQHLVS